MGLVQAGHKVGVVRQVRRGVGGGEEEGGMGRLRGAGAGGAQGGRGAAGEA